MTFKFNGWHSKTNGEPLPCTYKLYVSFHSPLWIQIGVVIQKRSNRSKSVDFSALVTIELWRMTSKNNRTRLLCHFKFVHNFVAICEFKLELRSGIAQLGSKSLIFQPVWNLTTSPCLIQFYIVLWRTQAPPGSRVLTTTKKYNILSGLTH